VNKLLVGSKIMLLYQKIRDVIGRIFIASSLCMVAVLPLMTQAQTNRGKNFISADDRFMALRDAAFHNDAAAVQMHAAALRNYEIPSYVDYYVLRSKIRTVNANEVNDFLKKYEGSAIADRLRNDWLLVLGQRGDWANFDMQFPQFVVADDSQVKCYALLSKAIKQQKVASEARTLLTSSRQYGEGCYALVSYLVEQQQFVDADVWVQIRIAAESSSITVAKKLAELLDVPEKRIAEAFDKPINLLKTVAIGDRTSRELYLIALGRVAKTDPEKAATALTQQASKLSATDKAQGWAHIALQAAQKLQPEALIYWQRADGATLSIEAHQWRVRSALREGDWRVVKNGVNAMPAELRSDATWIYWYGRALQNEGKKEEAQTVFASIADQMHFYGQLAMEERGQKIGVPAFAKPIKAEEISDIGKNPNLQRALKFYALNCRFEGTREWNWALRSLSEREHLVAAELARENNFLDRMVNTSDRTKGELDFNQRYPTPFSDSMYKATQTLGLDMAWAYGLIRQESRFVMNAKSHVGASGLMQLMPNTARYVAKKIGLGNFVPHQVNDVETNIALGTNYLNMVLTDLGGSQALASAAYNAGPGRPRAWRASLTRTVEGAIFAETIPFSETRGYVKNVLSNATYYAALLEKKPQSLKARLGVVVPKGLSATVSDLP
jgi:soluble lytic murein transglycosylase